MACSFADFNIGDFVVYQNLAFTKSPKHYGIVVQMIIGNFEGATPTSMMIKYTHEESPKWYNHFNFSNIGSITILAKARGTPANVNDERISQASQNPA